MREIEERGAEAVIAEAIDEALDGPDHVYLAVDIDVIDPGMAPGTGTPEPGGMLTREVLRAIRQIVGAVDLAGDGHRRGVAAVRPGRDDGDGRQPGRARGDQRARRPAVAGKPSLGRRARPPIGSRRPRHAPARLTGRCSTDPTPRPPRRSPGCTTST